ncbi:MAG: hypothetical protein IT379_26550 [Deltaproteobacteria bacterium]|nr:hypothetical protein [Deltaproteobacteria bacterium]
MATLLVFVDGIGLGTAGPHNPFDAVARDVLLPLAGRGDTPAAGWTLAPLDATLGVAGVPQSATGTASILTGMNVAAMVGSHQWAFPGPRVRAIIEEHSILRRAREAGRRVAYLNAFPVERARPDADVRRGACTCAALAGGGPLRTLDDLEAGRAALFDLTHELAIGHGIPVRPSTIEESARRIAFACGELDLALFELFLTDHAGHQSDGHWARREVVRTESFLRAMTRELDPGCDTIVVTSDHGNLEDLSTRGHTTNAVPALAWGRASAALVREMRDVSDVGRRVLEHVLAE